MFKFENKVTAHSVSATQGAPALERRVAEASAVVMLVRHAALELSSGRTNRAVAIVQAALEWHAFRPQLVGTLYTVCPVI